MLSKTLTVAKQIHRREFSLKALWFSALWNGNIGRLSPVWPMLL